MLSVKKYKPENYILKCFIKYYWFMESNFEISINNKLLPVNNTDIIINYSKPVIYEKNGIYTTAQNVHFNCIKNKSEIIKQNGKLKVFGISFYPHGIYPLLKVPLYEFTGKVTGLGDVLSGMSRLLEAVISDESISIMERIVILEKILLEEMNYDCFDMKTRKIFETFYSGNMKVQEISDNYGLNIKYLERLFMKYTGVSPKVFLRIDRFQKVIKKMLYDKNYKNLTELAYEEDYYDQTHFIKEFKNFTNMTPKEFLRKKDSVRSILNANKAF